MTTETKKDDWLDGQDLGSYLKKIRLKNNVSIERLSSHTKIRQESIIAIENNESIDHVPQAYYRGYIKCYCLFFGIDAEQALSSVASGNYEIPKSSYSKVNTFQFQQNSSKQDTSVTKARKSNQYKKVIMATILLIVVAGIATIAIKHSRSETTASSENEATQKSDTGFGSIIDIS